MWRTNRDLKAYGVQTTTGSAATNPIIWNHSQRSDIHTIALHDARTHHT